MTRHLNRVCLALLVVAALVAWAIPASLEAQAISNLAGRAVDQQGAVLPGVSVTLTGQDTGYVRDFVTTENGTFSFRGVQPGVYKVVAELPGFKKYEASNLKLEIGKTAVLDVVLEVGATVDEITVIGQAPLVDTTTNEV